MSVGSTTTKTSPPSNPLIEWVLRYRGDPVLFAREVLRYEPDEWQIKALRAYVDPANRRISIRSGHGVGKTRYLATCAWHHACMHYPQKTVVTAPTSAQLFDALWAEIKTLYAQLPDAVQAMFVVKSDRIEHVDDPAGSFIAARTSRAETPEALQGIHSDHVLLIGDEASGIPEAIFEAAAGSMSGHTATTILCGNPVRTAGYFFNTHQKDSHGWLTLRVSCEDSPRVSKQFIEEMEATYGGRDSNPFRVRVLGEFPLADADTIIPFELVESATEREIRVAADTAVVWGLDCARSGNDRTALAKRKGAVLLEPVEWWREPDLMATVGKVKHAYETTSFDNRPQHILVDAIGIGAGVADRLRELGLPARAINVSETAALSDKYRNQRAELWFRAREWFESKTVRIPRDNRKESLIEELTGITYKFTSGGKYQAESKDDLKRRGLRSPDLADAFCLTFAVNAVTALHGSKAVGSWSKPIKRGTAAVYG
jgi:hypothetical protein